MNSCSRKTKFSQRARSPRETKTDERGTRRTSLPRRRPRKSQAQKTLQIRPTLNSKISTLKWDLTSDPPPEEAVAEEEDLISLAIREIRMINLQERSANLESLENPGEEVVETDEVDVLKRVSLLNLTRWIIRQPRTVAKVAKDRRGEEETYMSAEPMDLLLTSSRSVNSKSSSSMTAKKLMARARTESLTNSSSLTKEKCRAVRRRRRARCSLAQLEQPSETKPVATTQIRLPISSFSFRKKRKSPAETR